MNKNPHAETDTGQGGAARITLFAQKDELPLALCIEAPDGRAFPLLEKGMRIPLKNQQVFSTATAYQLSAEFHFVLGNRPLAKDNISLCRIRVRDVKWSGDGVPKLELDFKVDRQRVLTIDVCNLDRKRQDILPELDTERITEKDVADALAAEKAHESEDAETRSRMEKIDAAIRLKNDEYDVYSIAKRKMSVFQKHAFRSACNDIQEVSRIALADLTQADIDKLEKSVEYFKASDAELKELREKVLDWYK